MFNYICRSCKKVFESDEVKKLEERYGFDYGPAKTFYLCPHCSSEEIQEAEYCSHCQEYHIETQNGICENCLKEKIQNIDYNLGFEYINDYCKELPLFIFEYIFDVEEPAKVNELLMNEIKMMFERKKVEDFLYNKPLLLNKIKEFVEEDFWSFSDFLKGKGEI